MYLMEQGIFCNLFTLSTSFWCRFAAVQSPPKSIDPCYRTVLLQNQIRAEEHKNQDVYTIIQDERLSKYNSKIIQKISSTF
jgi:hypothetical protein